MKVSTVLAAFLVVAAPVVGPLAPAAHAQPAKPKFSVGQPAEVQGGDGRWYSVRIDKFDKKTGKYTILILGMNERDQVVEDRLRAAGGGEVVDVKFLEARGQWRAKRIDFENQLKRVPWGNEPSEKDIREKLTALEASLAEMQKTWPKEDLKPALEVLAKYKAFIDEKAKTKASSGNGTGAAPAGSVGNEEAVALEAYYKPYYEAAKKIPLEPSAERLASIVDALEALDLVALEARLAADATKHPHVFKYYGAEEKNRYADLPHGGNKRPDFGHKALEQVNTYYVKEIYAAKQRLITNEAELAKGIVHAASVAQNVDDAVIAVRLARAVKACRPAAPGLEAAAKEAAAALEKNLGAIAPLITGPFHRANMGRLVGFSKKQTAGAETDADVVHELVPGKPLYVVGYLSKSVYECGATVPDADLGFNVTVYPSLRFQLRGNTDGLSTLSVYTSIRGPELKNVGTIVADLLPDPETVAFKSHLEYLPGLHFVQWLLKQPDGEHELDIAFTEYDITPKSPAVGRFKVRLTPETKAALKAYHEKLWAKKLASVVIPDKYGKVENREMCVNVSDMAKHGKLHWLSFTQTGKVMKPFPRQNEVNNFVGTGYGVFERDGRYEIIELGFTRLPTEQKWRWTGIGQTPNDFALLFPNGKIGPTLVQFGYEIPKENLGKLGAW